MTDAAYPYGHSSTGGNPLTAPLKGEGDTRTQTRVRRTCSVCGELATRRITYLLDGARSNPASAAYHHDDCTWCSDDEDFACEAHKRQVENNPPPGMSWCSTFDGERMPRLLLYWETD